MILPENIFIDTSAWVALADMDDTNHKKSAQIYPSLFKTYKSLVTNNLVIAESYVIIMNELGHKSAIDFLERIKTSPRITKIYSNEDIEREAEVILRKYQDQDLSYTDAVSFSIMKKYKIKKAFCFDKHFLIAGFIKIPA